MEIKHFDKFLLGLALAVLTAGIIFRAVAGGGVGKGTAPGNSVLIFTQWWEDELEPGALAALVDEFEIQNPSIRIRLDTRSYGETRLSLLNATEAGKDGAGPVGAEENPRTADGGKVFPDIVALDPQWLYELTEQNALEPLTAYREGGEFVLQGRLDMPEGEYGPWAIPLISFMHPLFYNIEILKSAGFDRPPKTRTEFLAYARAITDKAVGRHGTALSLGTSSRQDMYREILPWFWAAGTFPVPQGEANFNASRVIETLDFLDRFRSEGVLSPGSFSKTEEEKREEFLAGKIGMMIGSVRDIDLLREQMGEDNFGISAIPAPDGYIGKPAFGLSSWYAGIARASPRKDEAWRFLVFLSERTSSLAAQARAVPGNGNGSSGYIEANPFYAKAYDIYEAGDMIREFSGIPRAMELESLVREELYAMLEQGRSPEESAAAIQQRWEALPERRQGR
jgi:multiple sugar transport system substrate-binding protein